MRHVSSSCLYCLGYLDHFSVTLTSFSLSPHLPPLLQEVVSDATGTLTATEERKEKVPSPHLSSLVILTSATTLYGLAERVVATESLCVLSSQLLFFLFIEKACTVHANQDVGQHLIRLNTVEQSFPVLLRQPSPPPQ